MTLLKWIYSKKKYIIYIIVFQDYNFHFLHFFCLIFINSIKNLLLKYINFYQVELFCTFYWYRAYSMYSINLSYYIIHFRGHFSSKFIECFHKFDLKFLNYYKICFISQIYNFSEELWQNQIFKSFHFDITKTIIFENKLYVYILQTFNSPGKVADENKVKIYIKFKTSTANINYNI